MQSLPIAHKDFGAWLQGCKSSRKFKRWSLSQCPIAAYLRAQGHKKIEVNIGDIKCDDETYTAPKWAALFIYRFDRDISHYHESAPVSLALDALEYAAPDS
jgi:hypothetical protein